MKLEAASLARARILVVGDVMLDRYWSGDASRISPEAPVPVIGLQAFSDHPGGAANVALNMAALGAQVTLLGMVGADEPARVLRAALDGTSVKHALQEVAGSPTITKLRVLSRNQNLIRLDIEDGYQSAEHAPLLENYRAHLAQADVVLLSDYAKGTLTPITETLIEQARQAGKPVCVDPKGNTFSQYRGATLLTPNRKEFEQVVGVCADNADIEARGADLMRTLDLGALLITRSHEGMTLIRAGGTAQHFAAHRREVYDVTGAGDTVIGVVAASLAAGLDLEEATSLANHAAAIVVGQLGAAQVRLDELRDAVERADRAVDSGGVLGITTLVSRIARARERGERIVMTNGCFDLLHAGHLASLREMRSYGDRLIVAVNDDASVARLKGPSRPIVPLEARMALLAALDCVDWVVDFAEDTPAEIIRAVRPDVLAKGGDYQVEDIVGREVVEAAGGTVVTVPLVPGLSTSALIEKIRSVD